MHLRRRELAFRPDGERWEPMPSFLNDTVVLWLVRFKAVKGGGQGPLNFELLIDKVSFTSLKSRIIQKSEI